MRSRRVLEVAGVVIALALAAAPNAAAATDTISATCSWAGQSQTCDSTSWYPSAVSVTWRAEPAPDSTQGCLLGIAYHYDNDVVTTSSCSATWPGSPTTTLSQHYTIHVESSAPTASGAPTRPPDSNGWYNQPVTIAFSGSAFSGIASCTTAAYAGPAMLSARVTGSCRDNAGKIADATSSPFAYDAAEPSLGLTANTGDRIAVLVWTMADIAPSAGFEVVRRPGLHGKAPSVVYRGGGSSFRDGRVRNGVRYQYTLESSDAAGNKAASSIVVRPGRRLISPPRAARLTEPPLLLWTAVRRATYYNVQLYRGKKKVLSAWPARSRLQLASTWRLDRRGYHLRPGKYRWHVWPGFGRRAAGRYGRMIGSSMFVVTSHPR